MNQTPTQTRKGTAHVSKQGADNHPAYQYPRQQRPYTHSVCGTPQVQQYLQTAPATTGYLKETAQSSTGICGIRAKYCQDGKAWGPAELTCKSCTNAGTTTTRPGLGAGARDCGHRTDPEATVARSHGHGPWPVAADEKGASPAHAFPRGGPWTLTASCPTTRG